MLQLLLNKYVLAGMVVLAMGGFMAIQNYRVKQLEAEVEKRGAEIEKYIAENIAMGARLERINQVIDNNKTLLKKLEENEVLIRADIKEKIDIITDKRFEPLAEKKPGLIEIRANKATEHVFNEIEQEIQRFLVEYNK